VVNDSILLVDFVKQRAASGMAIEQAAREAVRLRFRPVLLTSLTTVLGLLPILLERSLQAQVLILLVASLAFGLMGPPPSWFLSSCRRSTRSCAISD
jgi:multidrug efflux pump subunit AcrB